MINGNLVGFAMFVIAALIILPVRFVIGVSDFSTMVIAGVALVVIDLSLRLSRKGKEKWLMGQNKGGYLFFIPVWVFGIAVVVLNVVNLVVVKK